MRFAIRLIAGGIGAVVAGVWFLSEALSRTDRDSPFAGGTWKGPLLIVLGIALVFMGIRYFRQTDDPAEHNASQADNERPKNGFH